MLRVSIALCRFLSFFGGKNLDVSLQKRTNLDQKRPGDMVMHNMSKIIPDMLRSITTPTIDKISDCLGKEVGKSLYAQHLLPYPVAAEQRGRGREREDE